MTLITVGRFLIVRPSSATAATAATLTTLTYPTRAFANATLSPSLGSARIACLEDDAQNRPQVHVLNTQTCAYVGAFTSATVDYHASGRMNARSFVLTVYRWLAGTSRLFCGSSGWPYRPESAGVNPPSPTRRSKPA